MKKYTQKFLSSVQWVCSDCGKKYGKRTPGIATYHIGTCGVCGNEKTVTEPRDFGYLYEIKRKYIKTFDKAQ